MNSVIEKYNLTQFDTENDASQTYTVAQGDTLQSIADKFNMSTDSLIRINDLKTDNYIYPGKTLTVLQVLGADGQPVANTTTTSATLTQTSNKTTDTGNVGDAYGTQQAPVIVQDERDGVKKYVPSDDSDSDSSSISVQNDYSNNDSNNSNGQTNSSVTVQNGDTIDSIASQAGTTVDNIKQLNNLNSDLLVVGQTLLV